MRLKTIAIVIGSFLIGIAAGTLALSIFPPLTEEGIQSLSQTTQSDEPKFVADNSLLNGSCAVGCRASISREDIQYSNYYIADYIETLEWLELIGYQINSSDVRDFVRLRDTLTYDNLGETLEDPHSVANTILGRVFGEMATRVDQWNGYRNFPVESCLLLVENETTGRSIHLYLKVPNGIPVNPGVTDEPFTSEQVRDNLEIPVGWEMVSAPPREEARNFVSECFTQEHLNEIQVARPDLVPDSRADAIADNKGPAEITDTFTSSSALGGIDLQQSSSTDFRNGRIDDETPFIAYPVTVNEGRSTVQITMDRSNEADSLDTLLYLVNSDGAIVAQNDDRVRGNTNSTLFFPQAPSGDYSIIATRYKVDRGNSAGDFTLAINVSPPEIETIENYAVSDADLEASGFPIEQLPKAENEWTILAYYGADTDLEPGIITDFKEFELGLENIATVNVIVMMDRHPRYTDSNGDWSSVRLFEVQPDVTGDATAENPTIDTQYIADLGELNMGDGQTFAQFLTWGMQKYPARNYAVAFASHGAGWQGLISDETNGNTLLSVPDLTRALATARETTGIDRFDLLVNDACLMSSVEYYSAIDEYFDFSLASPEVVINPALDMTQLTENLAANVGLEDIGQGLVSTYMNRDIPQDASDAQYLSHALTDLRVFDPVTVAVENFATVVNSDRQAYYPIIREARVNAYTYTRFLGDSVRIDVGDLMNRVIEATSDEELASAAQDVLTALDTAVLYGEAGSRAEQATTYYNIYFPEQSDDFDVQYFVDSPLENWATMLRGYYNFVTPSVWDLGTADQISFHPPLAPEVTITGGFPEVGSIKNGFRIGFDVVGRNFASGELTIDQVQADGTIIRQNTTRLTTRVVDEETGNIERINRWREGFIDNVFDWDSSLPVVTDGFTTTNALVIVNPDDNVAFLDGQYREDAADTWKQVTIAFDVATPTTNGVVQRVLSRSEGSDAVAAVNISPTSQFQVFDNVVTPDGRVVRQPGTIFQWGETGVEWRYEPAPSGTYNLALQMTAAGGTTGFDSTQVTVANDGLNADIRGDGNLTDIGVVLPRPDTFETWTLVDPYRPQEGDEDLFDQYAYRSILANSNDALSMHFLEAYEELFRVEDLPEGSEETPEERALVDQIPLFGAKYGFEITNIGNTFTLDANDIEEGFTVIRQNFNEAAGDIEIFGNDEVIGETENGTEVAVVDDSFEAIEFEYTYTTDEDTVINGRGFAFKNSTYFNLPYFMTAETDQGVERLSELYFILRDNLDVLDFDPRGVSPNNLISNVRSVFLNSASLPADWIEELTFAEVDNVDYYEGWSNFSNEAFGDLAHISMVYSLEHQIEGVEAPPLVDILENYQAGIVTTGAVNSETAITSPAENINPVERRTFYGQYHTWETLIYDVVRDGQTLRGRLYVTVTADNITLAVWAEVPTEFIDEAIPNIIEPTVDSYILFGF